MNTNTKTNIRLLSISDLEAFFIKNNDKSFRGKQVYDWLWKKHTLSFEDMNNLTKPFRQLLTEHFYINQTKINTIQKSTDKTIKVSFLLCDKSFVEGVLIPDKERVTACISSQVGCALNCQFCATGKFGFKRDLGFDEIFDEFALLNELSVKEYKQNITHIVYMGMGEPLMNYDNVMRSIKKLTSDEGLGISPRRITVSTVGIPSMIKKLADDKVKFNLAISLHSADNSRRSSIAPINKKHPLSELSDAIKYFYKKTQSRITYEYLLLKGINDTIADAKLLAEFCKISPCKINLIEYNNNDIPGFTKSDKSYTNSFADYLNSRNLVVNIRRSRGNDIKAACGQLANAF